MMSKGKTRRRRFLADLLFAGGTLTAVAFLAKVGGTVDPPTPAGLAAKPAASPSFQECPETPALETREPIPGPGDQGTIKVGGMVKLPRQTGKEVLPANITSKPVTRSYERR